MVNQTGNHLPYHGLISHVTILYVSEQTTPTHLVRDRQKTLDRGRLLQLVRRGRPGGPPPVGRLPPAAPPGGAAWRETCCGVPVSRWEELRLGELRGGVGRVVLQQTEDVASVDDGVDAADLELVAEPVLHGGHRRQHGRCIQRYVAAHQPHWRGVTAATGRVDAPFDDGVWAVYT